MNSMNRTFKNQINICDIAVVDACPKLHPLSYSMNMWSAMVCTL